MEFLYLLGFAKDWPGFIRFTVAARLFIRAGFIVLIVAGKALECVRRCGALWGGARRGRHEGRQVVELSVRFANCRAGLSFTSGFC
jgi:hypothetical protein